MTFRSNGMSADRDAGDTASDCFGTESVSMVAFSFFFVFKGSELQKRAERRRRRRFVIYAELLNERERGGAASHRSTLADERCLQEALSSHQQKRWHKSHLPKSPAAARRRQGAGRGGR